MPLWVVMSFVLKFSQSWKPASGAGGEIQLTDAIKELNKTRWYWPITSPVSVMMWETSWDLSKPKSTLP